jgi:hypothetical protein
MLKLGNFGIARPLKQEKEASTFIGTVFFFLYYQFNKLFEFKF